LAILADCKKSNGGSWFAQFAALRRKAVRNPIPLIDFSE
jgi:hypothetical protein